MAWKHPWNLKKFDNLYNKDERFLSILMKGTIAWLNHHILLYDESIHHFIFSTGSSYMYVETNGYEYKINETTGEDTMYMTMPRCVLELSDISFDPGGLSNRFVRGTYERLDIDETTKEESIKGFNAEIRRIPIEMNVQLTYVLSNMNEALVLTQELIDKFAYQHFFDIIYLGNVIRCGIEIPSQVSINANKIDFSSTETNQKTIQLSLKVTSNYPSINERTEVLNTNLLSDIKSEVIFNDIDKIENSKN